MDLTLMVNVPTVMRDAGDLGSCWQRKDACIQTQSFVSWVSCMVLK